MPRERRCDSRGGRDTRAGHSIVLSMHKSGARHTYHGVLHCEALMELLAQAATAQGIRSQRLPESLAFASGGPEI